MGLFIVFMNVDKLDEFVVIISSVQRLQLCYEHAIGGSKRLRLVYKINVNNIAITHLRHLKR